MGRPHSETRLLGTHQQKSREVTSDQENQQADKVVMLSGTSSNQEQTCQEEGAVTRATCVRQEKQDEGRKFNPGLRNGATGDSESESLRGAVAVEGLTGWGSRDSETGSEDGTSKLSVAGVLKGSTEEQGVLGGNLESQQTSV